MRRVLNLIFISLFFFKGTAFAGTLESTDDSSNYVQSELNSRGTRLIKSCKHGKCEYFPSVNSDLIEFTGSDKDWEEIFTRCTNFERINDFHFYTNLIASIALFWNVGGLMTGTKFVTAAANKVGRYKKIVNFSVDFIGTSASATAYNYVNPAASGTPYPSIPEDAVKAAEIFISGVLDPDSGDFFLPDKSIFGLTQIIKACTHDFDSFQVSRAQGLCKRGCHSEKKFDAPNDKKMNTSPGALPIKRELSEDQIDEITTYLNSLN